MAVPLENVEIGSFIFLELDCEQSSREGSFSCRLNLDANLLSLIGMDDSSSGCQLILLNNEGAPRFKINVEIRLFSNDMS